MAKYGATGNANIHSYFSASGELLTFYRDNASARIWFGEDGDGIDVRFLGETASAYVEWDQSADTLYGASSATLDWDGTVNITGVTTVSGVVTFSGSTTTIGNAASDKIGFFGYTATVQKADGTAPSTVLIDFGLMASA